MYIKMHNFGISVCLLALLFVLQFNSFTHAATNLLSKSRFLRFDSEPDSALTKLGQKVNMRCVAKPKESRIQWLINGEPVRIDERAIFTTQDSLIIQLPERADQNVGLYTLNELIKSEIQCRAEYRNQVLLSQPKKITVALLDDFLYSEDEVKVDVKERQIAVIPCNPPASPPQVVTNFAFKNRIIESNDEKYHLMPSGNLQIFNVTMEDSGKYQCIALNPYLETRKNSTNLVTLHVEKQFANDPSLEQDKSVFEKLEFLSTPKQQYTVIRGVDRQIFECVASSILPVTINWYRKDRRELPANRFKIVGGNLMLVKVQVTDQGVYHCEATNGHKTITATSELIVKQAPNIKTELVSKQAQIGDQVDYECMVNGNPIPKIDWYLNGLKLTELNAAQLDIIISATGEDSSKLIIKKVGEQHSGIIQCFASNDVSTVYSVAKLEVFSPLDAQGSITSEPAASSHKSRKNKNKSNRNRTNKTPDMVAPSKPKVIRLGPDSVLVHWRVPKINREPIVFFKIQYKDMELFNLTIDWETIDEDIAPNINSYAITSLKSDRRYKFRVVAGYKNNDSKESKVSEPFFLAKNPTNRRPTTVPVIYQSKSDNSTSIEIFWDCKFGSDEQIEGFIIHYRPTQSAETYQKIAIDHNSTTDYVINHLVPSKQYDIRIQSYNSAGVSHFSQTLTSSTQQAIESDQDQDSEQDPPDEPPEDPNLPFSGIKPIISRPIEPQQPHSPRDHPSNNNKTVEDELTNKPTIDAKPKPELEDNTIDNNLNKTSIENEHDNFKATLDPLSTKSPLFYAIVSISALIILILLVYCYTIVKRWMNRKNNNKPKGDNKFDLDDENFILKPEDESLNSFTKMNLFNEPLYSTNGVLSTNPHLTRKAIKNYNHNYATIGGKDRGMFSRNDVYDSSLMNVRVNKFCEDSITNSLLAINKASGSNQITKRDLPNHRISSHNLARPSNQHMNTYQHQQSNLHNKNLLLPELPDTKSYAATMGRHRPTTRNFEDLYGTTGTHFATINRSNSVARLNNGTLERKRKSSRNDLFSVLNIKEENELSPTQIVDLQSSPNFRTVRYVNGGLNNCGVVMNSTMNGMQMNNISMSNGMNMLNGTMNGVVMNNNNHANALNNGLNDQTNLGNLNNNASLNSSNLSSNIMNNSLNNYETSSPQSYLTTQQQQHHTNLNQQQHQQLSNRSVGVTQSSF